MYIHLKILALSFLSASLFASSDLSQHQVSYSEEEDEEEEEDPDVIILEEDVDEDDENPS